MIGHKIRGQVTIFIIIAIVIVVAVIGFFIFRGSLNVGGGIPSSLEPAENLFLDCLETKTSTGIDILGSQGGYIYINELDYDPGSSYMPFSSQLDFLNGAVSIPYWYYVSGNGIQKEQVPSLNYMEGQLERFIEEKISECSFDGLYNEGFVIEAGYSVREPKANVNINDNSVTSTLSFPLTIKKGEDSAVITTHDISVNSKLGKYYDLAREIYDYEQESLFLENYGVDTLNAYAPVTGVEFSCSPKIWNARNVSLSLREAIEINTLALKAKDGDYNLKDKENEYFVVPIKTDEANVQFMNLQSWPYLFEVSPSEEELMISNPVGNQPGLGILGFCYVSYHHVYNLGYPVLVQIYNDQGSQVFQFPIAVVIQGNQPRSPLEGEASDIGLPELCRYKNQNVEVSVVDSSLNPVDAKISFECFNTKCNIGDTLNGQLSGNFPQCVNGFVAAKAEGFELGKVQVSTNTEKTAEIILDRTYEKEVRLRVDGKTFTGNSIISFVDAFGERRSSTVYYPEQTKLELSEGLYNVSVSTFRDSTLRFPASTQENCIDVPQTGVKGIFGLTNKECFTTEFPEQSVQSALSGGGEIEYYVLTSELEGSSVLDISVESLPLPTNLDQLQDNYNLLQTKSVDLLFI